jgi:pimeloyl-ACP methyl ester carboxylesterase
VPVLVVHGDADEVIPYELGKRLAPLFPRAELFTVPGGHHNALWSDPAVLAKVRAFL